MLIHKLKSKIHRVVVTDTQLDYEGSCGISADLMEAANIQEHEQIHIYNLNNGERFTTYAIKEAAGIISIRGSATRKAMVGDLLVICTYCTVPEENDYQPIKVYVGQQNQLPNFEIEYYEQIDIEDCFGTVDKLYTNIIAIDEQDAKDAFYSSFCDGYVISKVRKI